MASVYTATLHAIVILYLGTCILKPSLHIPCQSCDSTAFLFHCAERGLPVSKWHPILLSETLLIAAQAPF